MKPQKPLSEKIMKKDAFANEGIIFIEDYIAIKDVRSAVLRLKDEIEGLRGVWKRRTILNKIDEIFGSELTGEKE